MPVERPLRPPGPEATFGQRLAWWREQRGWKTQTAFAKVLGIAQGSLSELEAKTTGEPAASTLLKAARLLRLEPGYLLHGKGPIETGSIWPFETDYGLYLLLEEEDKAKLDGRVAEFIAERVQKGVASQPSAA